MPIGKVMIGFFLLLFLFQLLPIQQVGSILYSNLQAKEIPGDHDITGKIFSDDEFRYLEHANFELLYNKISVHCLQVNQILQSRLSSRSSDDVQTPPPNYC